MARKATARTPLAPRLPVVSPVSRHCRGVGAKEIAFCITRGQFGLSCLNLHPLGGGIV